MVYNSGRGAPDLEFSNPAGTGFAGFKQEIRPEFRPDLPDLQNETNIMVNFFWQRGTLQVDTVYE